MVDTEECLRLQEDTLLRLLSINWIWRARTPRGPLARRLPIRREEETHIGRLYLVGGRGDCRLAWSRIVQQ